MDRRLPIPGPRLTMMLLNTNNVTKTKNTKQNWSRHEYRSKRLMNFGGKRIPFPAQMWTLINLLQCDVPYIKKNLSEMEIDEIKLKVQSKCENRLSDVEGNNNSSYSDQHHIIQPNGNIES